MGMMYLDSQAFIREVFGIDVNGSYDNMDYYCYYLGMKDNECDVILDIQSRLANIIHRPTENEITCHIGDNLPVKIN